MKKNMPESDRPPSCGRLYLWDLDAFIRQSMMDELCRRESERMDRGAIRNIGEEAGLDEE